MIEKKKRPIRIGEAVDTGRNVRGTASCGSHLLFSLPVADPGIIFKIGKHLFV